MNKRGQGLSTTAIILIILGLVVLAALIYYFVLGGNKLTPFLKTGDNVQIVVTQCSTYCSTGSNYDFCTKQMTVSTNGEAYNGTCNQFANNPSQITVLNNKKYETVGSGSSTIEQFKIAPCASITC